MKITARLRTLVLLGLLPAGPLASQTAPTPDAALLARAERILRAVPIFDGHNDLPSMILEQGGGFDRVDVALPQPGLHTDLARLRQGRVGAQFWSAYVTSDSLERGGMRHALRQIDMIHRLAERYPELELARTASDVVRIQRAGRIASLIGLEGGHAIEGSLSALRMFRELGVAYMTLTHSRNTEWADASTDAPRHGGLTSFGEQVVREMNRIGMLVDLSHVSPETMHDALRVSTAPIIFSHSSARALADHPRNVPDDVLRLVPANGGVVMVTFVPGFVSSEIIQWTARRDSLIQITRQAGDTASARQRLRDWETVNPMPRATLGQVADHFDHMRRLVGVDHIGVGSDFDGITSVPVGLEDVATYPALFAELLRRGYSDSDLRKIAGQNVLRVMRQAEAVSQRLRREQGPSLADVAR